MKTWCQSEERVKSFRIVKKVFEYTSCDQHAFSVAKVGTLFTVFPPAEKKQPVRLMSCYFKQRQLHLKKFRTLEVLVILLQDL